MSSNESNTHHENSIKQKQQQHIVLALGGNALLKRGEDMTMDNQRNNIAEGMTSIAPILQNQPDIKITIVHGNGPQVGLLLLESANYEQKTGLEQLSLDVLDAETEGMIGYLIEQELYQYLGQDRNNHNEDDDHREAGSTSLPQRGMVTILSQIVCDANDPAFDNPTKFVGPVYTKEESEKLGLPVKPDGNTGKYRRVVPSPKPVKMIQSQLQAIRTLTDNNCIVICAGGGGIPVVEDNFRKGCYKGIEAVIDKDRAAAMVGLDLGATGLMILTDVEAVCINFGTSKEKKIKQSSPKVLERLLNDGQFPDGSMGPKIESVIEFVTKDYSEEGRWAAIGSLKEADKILRGEAGTLINDNMPTDFIEYYS